ncbi:chemotaxis protein CheW [Azonexus hydrophilus]|uniref:Chemotaxis protein CheW n=1 Tax=Azonexus hydrophilus TaxID=418702 RepID=A0ABZ2XL95_9RHOO
MPLTDSSYPFDPVAFQAYLLERFAETSPPAEQGSLMLFHKGIARWRIARQAISHIGEAPSITPAPLPYAWIAGFFEYDGRVIPAINLASILLHEQPTKHVSLLRLSSHPIAILAEVQMFCRDDPKLPELRIDDLMKGSLSQIFRQG